MNFYNRHESMLVPEGRIVFSPVANRAVALNMWVHGCSYRTAVSLRISALRLRRVKQQRYAVRFMPVHELLGPLL